MSTKSPEELMLSRLACIRQTIELINDKINHLTIQRTICCEFDPFDPPEDGYQEPESIGDSFYWNNYPEGYYQEPLP